MRRSELSGGGGSESSKERSDGGSEEYAPSGSSGLSDESSGFAGDDALNAMPINVAESARASTYYSS